MELEVIRSAAAGVADPVIGLNAMIDALTLDQIGDPRPSHPTLYTYVDTPWVARKTLSDDEVTSGRITLPGLAIYLEAAPELDPEVLTDYRDGTFPVAFTYLDQRTDDVEQRRKALYANRALLRFLSRFNANENPGLGLRQRNGLSLYRCVALQQYTPFDAWGAALATASTVATFKVRENSP